MEMNCDSRDLIGQQIILQDVHPVNYVFDTCLIGSTLPINWNYLEIILEANLTGQEILWVATV
jgi:hypothetical protein